MQKYNICVSLDFNLSIEKVYFNLHNPDSITIMIKELKLINKPCIYVFHLNDSKNCYVGSTIEPHVRFKNHLSGIDSNKYLQNALNKYGKDNFTLYILKWVEIPLNSTKADTASIAVSAEQYYIDLLQPSFNFSKKAGWSRFGVSHTLESKEKMSRINILYLFKNIYIYVFDPVKVKI